QGENRGAHQAAVQYSTERRHKWSKGYAQPVRFNSDTVAVAPAGVSRTGETWRPTRSRTAGSSRLPRIPPGCRLPSRVRMVQPAIARRLDNGAPAGYQTHDEQHNGQHQQDVNERTDRVCANDSKEPRNQQNNRQGVKHFYPPPLWSFECKKRCLNRGN